MDEHMCEGESRVAIRQALLQGRLWDFFTLIASGLRSYNSDSPFVGLEVWYGASCSDCGGFVDDDEGYTCCSCNSLVCGGCESSCSQCGSSYLVIVAVAASSAIDYLLSHFLTGKTVMEDVNKSLAETPLPIITYLLLVFASTFAPVAEELFFRGFLYNAFRVRMPWTLAVVTQSLIFGCCHFFGAIHSACAALAGICLTLIYEWRKTLITPMLVHAGVNSIAAIGVAVMTMAYANSPVLGVTGEPNDTACVIRLVLPDSAAENAGLQIDDVITAIDGQAIPNIAQLVETIRRHQPGDTVTVSINRAGSSMDVNVVLQRRGDQRTD
jgi:hypothetical protein